MSALSLDSIPITTFLYVQIQDPRLREKAHNFISRNPSPVLIAHAPDVQPGILLRRHAEPARLRLQCRETATRCSKEQSGILLHCPAQVRFVSSTSFSPEVSPLTHWTSIALMAKDSMARAPDDIIFNMPSRLARGAMYHARTAM